MTNKSNSINRTVSMGSIEKVGPRKWRIRVRLGWDPETKRYRRSPSRTVIGTKADAREALEKYRKEIVFEIEHPDLATLFKNYANENFDARSAEGGSPLARIRERNETNKCIELYGDIPLGEITPVLIKRTNARVTGSKSMSIATLFRVNRRLRAILQAAVDDGILEDNPAKKVKVGEPEKRQHQALSLEEAQRLARCVAESIMDSVSVGIRILLFSGIRKGELLALTWNDVDFEDNSIHVTKSYSNDKVIRPPKSKNSNRWVSLDAGTMAMLAKWKRVQPESVPDGTGFVQTGSTPVITSPQGNLYDPTNFSRAFRAFCVAHEFGTYAERKTYVDKTGRKRTLDVGYSGLKPHSLRHTHATLLIGQGTDIKTASGRMGHASVPVTTEIYADFIRANDHKASEDFGRLVDDVL